MRTPQILCALSLAGVAPAAAAELVFDNVPPPQVVAFDADDIVLTFPFTVEGEEGDEPVTIESITSDCACLNAIADQQDLTYEVGETGLITAHFELDNATGLRRKSLEVHTSASPQPLELVAAVEVPEMIHILPSRFEWTAGQEHAIHAQIEMTEGFTPTVVNSESTKDWLEVSVTGPNDEGVFDLTATPLRPAEAGMGMIQVKFDHPHPRYQTRTAYFLVLQAAEIE